VDRENNVSRWVKKMGDKLAGGSSVWGRGKHEAMGRCKGCATLLMNWREGEGSEPERNPKLMRQSSQLARKREPSAGHCKQLRSSKELQGTSLEHKQVEEICPAKEGRGGSYFALTEGLGLSLRDLKVVSLQGGRKNEKKKFRG